MESLEVPPGLENVVVTTSKITEIGSNPDRILYRGFPVQALALQSTYEETAYVLLNGRLPSLRELEAFSQRLKSLRQIPETVQRVLEAYPEGRDPIEPLVAALSTLSTVEAQGRPAGDSRSRAERVIAIVPTIIAASARRGVGLDPLTPEAELSHAGNLLYMLSGKRPGEEATRYLDSLLILHADNELNTSTFCGRVAASTGADLFACIASAIGALKGPIHGGAGERVMKMVSEIGSPDRVEEYVSQKFAKKQRIVGFGHRVYTLEDPRATVLRELARQLSQSTGRASTFEILRSLELRVKAIRPLPVNVDLYSGCIYSLLGIDSSLFTSMFAIGRTAGWGAHVLEEYELGKLISPVARYVGSPPRPYVPMNDRSET